MSYVLVEPVCWVHPLSQGRNYRKTLVLASSYLSILLFVNNLQCHWSMSFIMWWLRTLHIDTLLVLGIIMFS